MTNKKDHLVVQFKGEGFPGLLYKASEIIFEEGLKIKSISTNSGGHMVSTFMTCEPSAQKQKEGLNINRAQVLLERRLREELYQLYEEYFKGKEEDHTNKLEIVKVVSEKTKNYLFRFHLEIIKEPDERSLIFNVTNILRTLYLFNDYVLFLEDNVGTDMRRDLILRCSLLEEQLQTEESGGKLKVPNLNLGEDVSSIPENIEDSHEKINNLIDGFSNSEKNEKRKKAKLFIDSLEETLKACDPLLAKQGTNGKRRFEISRAILLFEDKEGISQREEIRPLGKTPPNKAG